MTNEELNAEIAIKVMGWELLEIDYVGTEYETPRQKELEEWIDEVGIESVGHYWIDVEKNYWRDIYGTHGWKPTENIGQAWQVLEKFDYYHYYVRLEMCLAGWGCGIRPKSPPYTIYYEMAETAMLAICKCALRVVERNKND